MGFLRKLGRVVDTAMELADGAPDGIGPVADRPPVALRPDASSLADLEALAVTSGGRAGRAIVQSSDGVSEYGIDGARHAEGTCRVSTILRVREIDSGFGPRVEMGVWLPRVAALLIGVGLEVPVTRDPTTGDLVGIDRRALVEELRPHFDEVREASKARGRGDLGRAATAIREAVVELGQPTPATEPSEIVEGVTADQWLQARRVLATGRIPAAVFDRTLKAYGIPAGRWSEIDIAWSACAATDPALADRLANL